MQHLIGKLKLVDERFAEAGWLPEYEYRKLLAEVMDELQQKCEQTNVSGSLPIAQSRCCGRCDGVNDICVADMFCEAHGEQGCEDCFGKRK